MIEKGKKKKKKVLKEPVLRAGTIYFGSWSDLEKVRSSGHRPYLAVFQMKLLYESKLIASFLKRKNKISSFWNVNKNNINVEIILCLWELSSFHFFRIQNQIWTRKDYSGSGSTRQKVPDPDPGKREAYDAHQKTLDSWACPVIVNNHRAKNHKTITKYGK
jgi:hypothetical protein